MSDDHDDLELHANLAMRRLMVIQAVTELAMARAQQVDDDQIRVYTTDLIDIDTDLVVAACRYLGKQRRKDGETAFPSVGDIRDRCWQIRRDEQRAEEERAYEEQYRRDRDVIPQARAEMWMAHLKAVSLALKYGHRPPETPEVLDSRQVTYRCADCQDTGFVRACHCESRACKTCRYQSVTRCLCRPQSAPAMPPEPKPARARRGTGWHRSGE